MKRVQVRSKGGILTPTSGIIKIAGRAYREDKNNAKQLIGYLQLPFIQSTKNLKNFSRG